MKRLLKIICLLAVGIPLLLLATCLYREITRPAELRSLCDTASAGIELDTILNDADHDPFRVRTGGTEGKDDSEWFDREYLRIKIYLEKTRNYSGDYSVVFVKPGLGYYACIIIHENDRVKTAWFEDRSS